MWARGRGQLAGQVAGVGKGEPGIEGKRPFLVAILDNCAAPRQATATRLEKKVSSAQKEAALLN